jgi:hypothetical protein
MITSLSRFITWRTCAQERRKCSRDLCRCASVGRYIDLVQIQRLLVQTDGDLREASLGSPRNKCGTITHCFVQGCHPAGKLGQSEKRTLNCGPRIAVGPRSINSSRKSINKSYMRSARVTSLLAMLVARTELHTFGSKCPQCPHCQLKSTCSGQSVRSVHTVN